MILVQGFPTGGVKTSTRVYLYSLTSSNGFSQLINEPTHIQANISSCIYLIITDQPNLAMNSREFIHHYIGTAITI